MTVAQIEKILNKKGKMTSLIYRKLCKTYKGVDDIIEKETRVHSVQIGAGYDNCKRVISGREDGTLPLENAGLNGLEWVSYPYILRNPKTGKEYVRITRTANSHFDSKFFENGIEVEKSSILDKLTAAEKSKRSDIPLVMNIPLDSIINLI